MVWSTDLWSLHMGRLPNDSIASMWTGDNCLHKGVWKDFSALCNPFVLDLQSYVFWATQGNGYEAWQNINSEEQTKIPRFMLEGPRPCTVFVLRSYTKHELRNQNVSVSSSVSSKTAIVFCAQSRSKKRTKSYNHSALLTIGNFVDTQNFFNWFRETRI